MHNLSFKAADHLSELFPFMFPDSAIAAFKRTKTKSIVSDAYMKKPVIEILRVTPFSLLCGDSIKLLTILVRLYDYVNDPSLGNCWYNRPHSRRNIGSNSAQLYIMFHFVIC